MNLLRQLRSLLAVTTMLFLVSASGTAAATLTVSTTTDEYDTHADCTDANEATTCSLREAFRAASEDTASNHDIVLAAETYTFSIANSSGDEDNSEEGDLDLDLGDNTVTITGQGSTSTIIDANELDRILEIPVSNGDGQLTISDLTMRDGLVGETDAGGAVSMLDYIGTVTISNVIVSGNSARDGAGLYLSEVDDVTISDSHFLNNTSSRNGAALYIQGADDGFLIENSLFESNSSDTKGGAFYLVNSEVNAQIINSTFTDNTGGSGIADFWVSNDDMTADILFSTFADNTVDSSVKAVIQTDVWSAGSGSLDVTLTGNVIFESDDERACDIDGAAVISSGDYNIVHDDRCGLSGDNDMEDTDALLDGEGLSDNGGNMETIALQSSSPAIDSIPSESCLDGDGAALTEDARGMTRPENDDCDAGAYEFDQTAPTVTLDPVNDVLECGVDTWSAPTATVSDNFDTTVTTASVESNNVDEDTAGLYNVVYASTADYDGNIGRASQPVTVEDTTVPVITVTGDTAVTTEAGETYTDAGAAVADLCDESASATTSGTVDTGTLGEYTLTYSSTDVSDNDATQKTRTVTVEDTTAPVITLTGESAVTLTVGDSYTDAGATAIDSFEGTLTSSIVAAGTVDTDTVGTYTITYNVSDSSGNAATQVTRTVTVEEETEEEEPEEGGDEEEPEEGGDEENPEEDGGDDSEGDGEEGDTDNDPETGEGDGSDDTEETLGEVVSLTRSTDSMVTVEYEDGSTKTFQLFNASAKAKVQLHTNGAILIAVNKTYMRTFNAFTGEQLDQVKLFKKKQYKTKFKRFNIYKKVPGKNNVMVLAQTKQKHKKQFKLRSFVVKNGGAITKRPYRTIELNNNAKFANLSIAKNSKNGKNARILIKKKGKTLKNWKYRVTKKKGIIKKAI